MDLTIRAALLTAFGGAIGAPARLILTVLITNRFPQTLFPVATLAINVIGSFLLALLFWSATDRFGLTAGVRLLIGTGLLGAFTTYSTFSVETLRLVERDRTDLAVLYVVLTTGLSLLAVVAGIKLVRIF